MTDKEKLKNIINESEVIASTSYEDIGGIKVLKGFEFEKWKAKIKGIVIKYDSNELTKNILKLVDSFNGYGDERKFNNLLAEVTVLAEEFDSYIGKRSEDTVDSKKVFVVHGRNNQLRTDMFNFLRSIGVKPIEWNEAKKMTGKPSPYIGDVLDCAFSNAQAIIVMFSPDDEAKLRDEFIKDDDPKYEKELSFQSRPNVIFEAGMALGRMEDRTIIVEFGKMRKFTDIVGRHTIRFNGTAEDRQDLIDHLKIAKVDVEVEGKDWLSVGEFKV